MEVCGNHGTIGYLTLTLQAVQICVDTEVVHVLMQVGADHAVSAHIVSAFTSITK